MSTMDKIVLLIIKVNYACSYDIKSKITHSKINNIVFDNI